MAALPNETTILKFRHLLEKHKLTEQVLTDINYVLKEQDLLMLQGNMVDATIAHAPSSIKTGIRCVFLRCIKHAKGISGALA